MKQRGFSLMDVLIATVIVAILVSIAVPSFQSSVRRSRRADAVEALRTLQLSQERWRSNHTTYGTTSDILGGSTTSPGGWYTLAITVPTATGYTATATAIAGNSQNSDTAGGVSCSTMTVNQDAPVFSPAGQTACWGQ